MEFQSVVEKFLKRKFLFPGISSPLSSKARLLYFAHPLVDFLAVGGASIFIFFIFLTTKSLGSSAVPIAYILSWVVNYPHFAATNYRLYGSRESIAQYPITAYGSPLLVLAFVAGSLLSPAVIAPAFVKLYLLWSPYHFSGQSVGITMVYAHRAGIKIEGIYRKALSFYIYGSFILMSARSEVGLGSQQYHGVHYPLLGLPAEMASVVYWIWIACAAVFCFFVLAWSLQNRRLFPWIVLLPGMAQLVWFVIGPSIAAFYIFVPLFHALQYLFIAWLFQLKDKKDREGEAESGKKIIFMETAKWGIVIFVMGAFLFEGLPRWTGKLTGVPLDVAMGVVLAAVQVHHFFVDGVIWKLRNKNVSSPLMMDLQTLWDSPKAAPARVLQRTA